MRLIYFHWMTVHQDCAPGAILFVTLHTLGSSSHPHAAASVLSYVYKAQRALTPLDLNLIHTLYDPRMTPGLQPAT
jgi:hypothetical protein